MSAQSLTTDRPQLEPAPDTDGGWLAAARDMAGRWVTAFNSADAAALAALYDKDVVMFPTGRAEPLVGADAVRQFFAGMDWSSAVSPKVELSGAAFTRLLSYRSAMTAGAYTFSRLENGARAYLAARYSFVLTRDGDAWRIAHHHSSAAPQPPGADRRRATDKE